MKKEDSVPCGYTHEDRMEKRFHAACAAMQGLLSSGNRYSPEVTAKDAFRYADELLKQE